jgi:NAD-dependent protein deacetylase/lipoamidase
VGTEGHQELCEELRDRGLRAGLVRALSAAVAELAGLIVESECTVALTGAGVSVPSGIPDFRTPETGLWEKVDPMEVAHIDVFERDPARFWSYYRPRFHSLGDKRPNAAHEALAELERRGLLEGVITQNVDRLHRAAGSTNVVEVHGSIETSSCTRCQARFEIDEVDGLFDAEGVARCSTCSSPVKPDVVLFGELLPQSAIAMAQQLAERAELLICVGSSLAVHPVAALPRLTLESGGRLAIVTKGPTPYDVAAELKLDGEVDAELEALLDALS